MAQSQVYLDLSKHLNQRIRALVGDAMEVSQIAELDGNDALCLVFGNLVGIAAQLVIKTEGDKMDFLNACSLVYDRAVKS